MPASTHVQLRTNDHLNEVPCYHSVGAGPLKYPKTCSVMHVIEVLWHVESTLHHMLVYGAILA